MAFAVLTKGAIGSKVVGSATIRRYLVSTPLASVASLVADLSGLQGLGIGGSAHAVSTSSATLSRQMGFASSPGGRSLLGALLSMTRSFSGVSASDSVLSSPELLQKYIGLVDSPSVGYYLGSSISENIRGYSVEVLPGFGSPLSPISSS